jgi:glycosyltransferase involved in cell wall biosynthesis
VTHLRALHLIGGGDTGGAMTHLLPLLGALGRAGCDIHLACLGEGALAEQARQRGLAVGVLPMNGAHDVRVLGPLGTLLSQGPATGMIGGGWDVVHTHGMRANLPVRLVASRLGNRCCLLTTVHSDIRLDYGSPALARVYGAIDRRTLQRVDCVICVSDSLRELLVSRGYPARRLVTVHSGLEFSGGGTPVERPRDNRPRVGTVARLVPVKDIDLLLEVAGLLRRTHPEVEMTIIGDGPERGRLEGLARAVLHPGTVHFAGHLDDAKTALAALDVYLVTSRYEGGVSMSVLEAMEKGLPVVTTAAGGVEEAVVNGETGYVVSGDRDRGSLAAALAERTGRLLDDQALRARMGAAGNRRVRAEFSVDHAAAVTVRVYERCLAARTSRS